MLSEMIQVIAFILGLIVYNQAVVYKLQNFLKVMVHVFIIDQCVA